MLPDAVIRLGWKILGVTHYANKLFFDWDIEYTPLSGILMERNKNANF